MPVPMNADRYNMSHKNRGKCVVFNHEYFDTGFEDREGSSYDAKKIQHTFQNLGFEVEILDNLVHAEVIDKITKRKFLSRFTFSMNFYREIFIMNLKKKGK